MGQLEKRVQKKKTLVYLSVFVFMTCSLFELYLFSKGQSYSKASLLTFTFGFLGLMAFHWSLLKERQFVVLKLMKNLTHQKSKSVDTTVLKNVIKKDISAYLNKTHFFAFKNSMKEFDRLGELHSYLEKYKEHSDLNLLEKASKKVLEKNNKFFFPIKELVFESGLLVIPFFIALSGSAFFESSLTFTSLVFFRAVTCLFFGKSLYQVQNQLFSTNRLENFLFGTLMDSGSASTRLELKALKETKESSVFFLIDAHRKTELDKVLEFQTSGQGDFKEWSVISAGNSSVKNKANSKNAFIVFPSEIGFPYEEMKEFFQAFDKVIVIDSNPSYALKDSAVYYLDHNQGIKKVSVDKNLDRMSGDKGLILRNLDQNNFSEFLSLVEEKSIKKEPFFLVYKTKKQEEKKESVKEASPRFTYPLGETSVVLTDKVEGVEKMFYCDLSRGTAAERLESAKNFLANCSYHQIYTNQAAEEKMKNLFRAS